jgi:S1-C subfamily serine protease
MIARWFAAPLVLCLPIALTTPAAAQIAAPRPRPAPDGPRLPPAALPSLPLAALPPLPPPTSKGPAPPLTGPPSDTGPISRSADIRKLSASFADIAEKVSPSVVQIDVTAGGVEKPLPRWIHGDDDRRGLGSGVIFSSDGAVLTNNHVIEEARSINVRLRDGRTFPGRVVGRDPATDLAVLRIDVKDLAAATFADSDAARTGEWVLAIGSPFGLGHTVTTGVLSAKARGGVGINAVEDYLQTDASINPGNSGGPLVNLDGKVLGINTMIVSRGQGIGLAVPATMARRVAEQILKIGRVDRAYIGLGMQDLTPQLAAEMPAAPPAGALVNTVAPNGPAGRAHLEPGDVITSFGSKPIRDAQDVIREVFLRNVGDVATLEVVRGGKRFQSKVTLMSRNDPPPPPLPVERKPAPEPGLGLSLRDMEDGADKGVKIAAVAPDSAADRAGVRAGDSILAADGIVAPTAKEVQSAAQDGHMLLRIQRRGTVFYAAVRR